ncbi:uncharacterized protein METZ01_LOCUS427258, partial [marine metagenome]
WFGVLPRRQPSNPVTTARLAVYLVVHASRPHRDSAYPISQMGLGAITSGLRSCTPISYNFLFD